MNAAAMYEGAQDRAGRAIGELVLDAQRAELKERRLEPRYPFFRPVVIRPDDGKRRSFSAFTREISASGIGLLHNMELEPGETDIVILTDQGRAITLPARIVWCRPCGEGWYLSGARFSSTATEPNV